MMIVLGLSPTVRAAVVTALIGACTSSGGSAGRDDSLGNTGTTSPAAQQANSEHVASVGDITISLNACRVTARRNIQAPAWHADVPLPGNCRFVVDTERRPQVVNTSRGPTLLVMSSTRLPEGRFCDTRVRAIVVRDRSSILISDGEQRIRSCATGPFDTTMFHVLAESSKAP